MVHSPVTASGSRVCLRGLILAHPALAAQVSCRLIRSQVGLFIRGSESFIYFLCSRSLFLKLELGPINAQCETVRILDLEFARIVGVGPVRLFLPSCIVLFMTFVCQFHFSFRVLVIPLVLISRVRLVNIAIWKLSFLISIILRGILSGVVWGVSGLARVLIRDVSLVNWLKLIDRMLTWL